MRSTADARRSRSRSCKGPLFCDWEIGRGRDHGTPPDVQIADRTRSCGFDARRGRNHQILQRRRIPSVPKIGRIGRRRHDGALHLRRDPGDLRCRGQRNGWNGEAWLFSLVGPRHNIRQGNVALQLDIGWRHDGLRSIVGPRRKRNHWLAREFRVRFLRLRRRLRSRIDGWKIFRRLVINYLCSVEGRPRYHPGLERKEPGESNQQSHRDHVIDDRLQKSSPWKGARHEHVWPERRRSGMHFKRGKAARKDEIAEIAEEDTRPRRQLDQKPWNRRGLRDFADRDCGHLFHSRCRQRDWGSREDIHFASFSSDYGQRMLWFLVRASPHREERL